MSAPFRIAGRIHAYSQQRYASISSTGRTSPISNGTLSAAVSSLSSTALPSLGSIVVPPVSARRMYSHASSFYAIRQTDKCAIKSLNLEPRICKSGEESSISMDYRGGRRKNVSTLPQCCIDDSSMFIKLGRHSSSPIGSPSIRYALNRLNSNVGTVGATQSTAAAAGATRRGASSSSSLTCSANTALERIGSRRGFSSVCNTPSRVTHGGSFAEKRSHFMMSSPWGGAMAVQVRTRRCRGGKVKTKLRREARRQRRDQKEQMKGQTITKPPSMNLG